MSLELRISANRPEDLPQLVAANIVARGKARIGCDLIAETNLEIYPNKAKVTTSISDYASLPPEMKGMSELIHSYFINIPALQKGTPMFVSIPGPIWHTEQMSKEDYDVLLSAVNGSVQFPSVKSWTWQHSSKVPEDSEVQQILTDVNYVITKFFPNQEKREMEVESAQGKEELDIAFEPSLI